MDDAGRREVDRELDRLERRISEVYKQAAEESQKKLDDYLKQFAKQDADKQKQLADGKITQKEYDNWRRNKVLVGKRWRAMRDTLAQDFTNADKIAASLSRGELPDVYAMGHNFGAYQIENDTEMDLSYTLYDRRTVERLLRDDPDLLPEPRVDIPKDRRWNRQHIQSAVLQGLLQGEPIDKIAKRLRDVSDMDERAAVRNARTAVTGAENAGRIDSYRHAQDLGIDLQQEWLSTLDSRTRDSHRLLDGERVTIGARFSNGLRFPGDPQGAPAETYSCRCTLVAAIKGIDQSNAPRNSKLGDMSYEEWKKGRRKAGRDAGNRRVAQGQDITGTWKRDKKAYEFGIVDVMHAQGFDGLPKLVGKDEFEKAVQQSKFVAQRTYSAKSEDVLKGYRDKLYNGEWYVDCSDGGSIYGQGMYCASDYKGKLSSGIDKEMKYYQKMHEKTRGNNIHYTETFTLDPSAKIADYYELDEVYEKSKKLQKKFDDIGTYAAALGYDAIKVDGRGRSGSYTVVLNRTKVIFEEA